MGIKCFFGFHDWQGCICSRCDKTRDKEHTIPPGECKCQFCDYIEHDLSKPDYNEDHWESVTTDILKASPQYFTKGYYLAPCTCLRCGEDLKVRIKDWDSQDPEFD